MDAGRFDLVARAWSATRPRRPVLGLLAGGVIGLLPLIDTAAKKKKKKVTLCLNGQTIKVPKKKQKVYLNQGATPGVCSPKPPPCVQSCSGKPCGVDDGCDGVCGCPSGQMCQSGTCHACDVTCSGNATQCGAALQQKIDQGGTIRVCPGRYAGELHTFTTITLIGAGQGDDPASSTILDGLQADRVFFVEQGATAVLEQLRFTGGRKSFSGGGVYNAGTLTMNRCTVTGNRSTNASGGGVYQSSDATGGMTLTDCTISGNDAGASGGGLMQSDNAHQVTLTNCIVSGNHAGGSGGGVGCSFGVLRMAGGSVAGNSAQNFGGGMWASGNGDAAVSGVTMNGNTPENCTNVTGCAN